MPARYRARILRVEPTQPRKTRMLSDSAFRIAFPGAMANPDAFMRGFVTRLHEHGVPQEKAAEVLELAANLALAEKPEFNVGFAEKFAGHGGMLARMFVPMAAGGMLGTAAGLTAGHPLAGYAAGATLGMAGGAYWNHHNLTRASRAQLAKLRAKKESERTAQDVRNLNALEHMEPELGGSKAVANAPR